MKLPSVPSGEVCHWKLKVPPPVAEAEIDREIVWPAETSVVGARYVFIVGADNLGSAAEVSEGIREIVISEVKNKINLHF